MKLTGNSRKSAHIARKHKKFRRLKIALAAVLGLAIVLAVAAFILIKTAKPPEVNQQLKPPSVAATGGATSSPIITVDKDGNTITIPAEGTPVINRHEGTYTFLVLGMDDGNGNTDTIMVATLDTIKHDLHVVSIPRDTMVNVSWGVKKANTIFSNARYNAKDKKDTDAIMKTVNAHFANLLGYELDIYSIINLKAFATLIDAIGGVYFDVPRNFDYDDDSQNLSIHIKKGAQTLNGKNALGVVRFRMGNNNSGYVAGDIGRIDMQQKFLKAAVKQILENKNKINLTSIINIYINDVDTNLNVSNMTWLAGELFKLDAENITFDTIPADYNDDSGNCTIYVNKWLTMLNEQLNPFDYEIKAADLSILTRGSGGAFYVTDGNSAGRIPSGDGAKPSASPSSSPSSSPSGSPSASSSASPSGDDPTVSQTETDGIPPGLGEPSPDPEVTETPTDELPAETTPSEQPPPNEEPIPLSPPVSEQAPGVPPGL